MFNYLQIIFKCDIILQIFFLYFSGVGKTIFRSMEKILKEKTPPLWEGGSFLEGTIHNRNI